jgi:hypothetical protein
MEYFGTDLTSPGHYLWILQDNDMYRNSRKVHELPFNPEGLPCHRKELREKISNGFVQFHHFAGFTICAIEGSCSDHRSGSKSIFFIEEVIPFTEMIDKIMSNPTAKRIMQKMTFEVKFYE